MPVEAAETAAGGAPSPLTGTAAVAIGPFGRKFGLSLRATPARHATHCDPAEEA